MDWTALREEAISGLTDYTLCTKEREDMIDKLMDDNDCDSTDAWRVVVKEYFERAEHVYCCAIIARHHSNPEVIEDAIAEIAKDVHKYSSTHYK